MLRSLLVALALMSAALFALPAGRAAADVDISGQWSLALTHPDFGGTIFCGGPIGQGGTTLSSHMTCDFFGTGTLSGSINTTSGALMLSGTIGSDTLNFSGTAAGNGNSMSGTWTVTGIPATGAFNGNRTQAVGGLTELTNVGEHLTGGGSSPAVWQYAVAVVGALLLSTYAVGRIRSSASRR